jgi:hypothetical protein
MTFCAASSLTASEQTLVGASGFKYSKEDRKAAKVKLRKLPSAAKKKPEQNGTILQIQEWEHILTGSMDVGVKAGASSNALSPVLPAFDEETMANFPSGRQEPLETLICKHCKKVVLRRTAKDHVAMCLKSKQDKARKKKEAREAAQRAKERAERADDEDDEDDDVRVGARKSAANGDDDGTKKGKKRKADADDDKEPKKKKSKKEEQKAKAPKPKGPVDVEKQCGVTLPNGAQCARSLTCKSHSMGAKRAVPGRSLPYDMLLAAYQKKNQARQQSRSWHLSLGFIMLISITEAAIDANAPAMLEDDDDPTLAGPVDSDEEKEAVMTGIARSLANPQPLVTRTLFPTRQKYQLVRMKALLSNAMSGNRSGNLFSVPADSGRSAMPQSALGDTFASQPLASPAQIGAGMAQPGMKAPRRTSIDVT